MRRLRGINEEVCSTSNGFPFAPNIRSQLAPDPDECGHPANLMNVSSNQSGSNGTQSRTAKPVTFPVSTRKPWKPSISMGTIQPYTRGQSAEGYRELEVHGCPEGNENGNVTQFGSTQRWMMPGNLASQSQLLALGHPTVDTNRINLTEDDVREPSQPEPAASPGHFNDERRQRHRRL